MSVFSKLIVLLSADCKASVDALLIILPSRFCAALPRSPRGLLLPESAANGLLPEDKAANGLVPAVLPRALCRVFPNDDSVLPKSPDKPGMVSWPFEIATKTENRTKTQDFRIMVIS